MPVFQDLRNKFPPQSSSGFFFLRQVCTHRAFHKAPKGEVIFPLKCLFSVFEVGLSRPAPSEGTRSFTPPQHWTNYPLNILLSPLLSFYSGKQQAQYFV